MRPTTIAPAPAALSVALRGATATAATAADVTSAWSLTARRERGAGGGATDDRDTSVMSMFVAVNAGDIGAAVRRRRRDRNDPRHRPGSRDRSVTGYPPGLTERGLDVIPAPITTLSVDAPVGPTVDPDTIVGTTPPPVGAT